MNRLQRVACISTLGASRRFPQAALEALLLLAILKSYYKSEARSTAFRLAKSITQYGRETSGHLELLADMLIEDKTIAAPDDRRSTRYIFDRNFGSHFPDREDWPAFVQQNTNGEFWFTDASVKQMSSGYGILDDDTGHHYSGYLGQNVKPLHAELLAIQICCIQASKKTRKNTPLFICTDSTRAIKALKVNKTALISE